MSSPESARLAAEMQFAERMGKKGAAIFLGDSTPDQRKELFRKTIIDGGIEFVVCIAKTRKSGKPETFGEFFERFYGEPLQPKRKKSS